MGPTKRRSSLRARGAAGTTRRGCHQPWGRVGTTLPSIAPARGAPCLRCGGLQGLGTSGSGCWGLWGAGTSPTACLWGRRSREQWQRGSSFSSRDPWSGVTPSSKTPAWAQQEMSSLGPRSWGSAPRAMHSWGNRDGGQDPSLGAVGWHRENPRCLAGRNMVLFCPVPAAHIFQRGATHSWPGNAG